MRRFANCSAHFDGMSKVQPPRAIDLEGRATQGVVWSSCGGEKKIIKNDDNTRNGYVPLRRVRALPITSACSVHSTSPLLTNGKSCGRRVFVDGIWSHLREK